ncbi:MAG: hypothetical protein H0U53_10590 [Actinobacteria bacterium]|nr:hypothetical protein [Actinomycetota bacterium]
MIEVLIIGLLACLALAYVAYPMSSGPTSDLPEPSKLVEEAGEKKRSALVAIVDMEEERATGKLSEEDFVVLRSQYEAEAIAALRQLDALQSETGYDADLEAEIAQVRASLMCPSCGALRDPGSKCSSCAAL